MPSSRYYIAIAPIEHINGKMAPVAVKCPDTSDPEKVKVSGFWYGYKRKGSNVSRYAIRETCRDLNKKPYTESELDNRELFRISLLVVQQNKAIPSHWSKMRVEFRLQSRYTTEMGYAVATTRANGGEWPLKWT